jgi:hypothetical protein
MVSTVEKEQGEKTENNPWLELRKEALRQITLPINLLSREFARAAREIADRVGVEWSAIKEITREQIALQEVLMGIIEAHHITVGNYSCACGRCQRVFPPDQSMTGDVVSYRKGIHRVAVLEREPVEYELVRVIRPFIGDNLLQEQIQPVMVAPLRLLRSNGSQQEGLY